LEERRRTKKPWLTSSFTILDRGKDSGWNTFEYPVHEKKKLRNSVDNDQEAKKKLKFLAIKIPRGRKNQYQITMRNSWT